MIWTIKAILAWTTQYFKKLGLDSPRVDAELLLTKVLNCSRIKLYIDQDKPLSQEELSIMHNLVERRSHYEPVAYILGSRGFMQDDFLVNASVLIPRPETELLVEQVAKFFPEESIRFLDIGTGSGAIAVSLAKLLPLSRGVAVDISPEALKVARKNAENIGMMERLQFLQSDIYSALETEKFDVIVANPPYIKDADMANLDKDVQLEPRLALAGGADGLDFYRRIIAGLEQHLTPEGVVAFEFGIHQSEAIRNLLITAGYAAVAVTRDYAGIERDIYAAKQNSKYADRILAINKGK